MAASASGDAEQKSILGDVSSRAAMTFVLVHGGAFTAQCWHKLLSCMNAPVLAPDLPGRADNPADHATLTLEDCARSVLSLMDRKGVGRAHLVGHSLGGATLLALARLAPERIASLIFVSAPIPADSQPILSAIGASSQAFIRDTAALGEVSLPIPVFPGELGAAAASMGTREAVNLFLEPVRLGGLEAVKRVAYIRLTQDTSLPLNLQDNAVGNIEAHRTCDVLDLEAGHMAMLTVPEALAAILSEAVSPWTERDS